MIRKKTAMGRSKRKKKDSSLPMLQPHEANEREAGRVPFPVHVMSGAAGDFAEIYSSVLESPIQFFYMSYLTCLGAMFSENLNLKSTLKIKPRLYLVILGRSATSRKSEAPKQTIKHFEAHENGFYVGHGFASGEALAETIRNEINVLSFYDELQDLINKSKSQPTLLNSHHKFFEEERYENRTRDEKTSIFIENGHLSFIGCCTLDIFRRIFNKTHVDHGFYNRLILVAGIGEKKNELPDEIEREVKEDLYENFVMMVFKAYAHAEMLGVRRGDNIEYMRTPEAVKRHKEWYMDLTSEPVADRVDTYFNRLLPLLAFNDGKAEIDLETVEKCIKLMDYQVKLRRVCHPILADNKAAEMYNKIKNHLMNVKDKALPRGTLGNRCAVSYYGWNPFDLGMKWLLSEGIVEQYEHRRGIYYRLKERGLDDYEDY